MSSVVESWLTDNALKLYQSAHRELILAQVIHALRAFSSVQPKTDVYTYDDGRSHLLLCLHGLLPISFRSQSYNIPIALWLPLLFPRHPPIVYVRPNESMLIKPSHLVDVSGKCDLPYLANWLAKPEACNLTSLLQAMQDVFSRSPPLYAKPPSPQPSSSLASNQLAHSSMRSDDERPVLPPKPNASSSSPTNSPSSHLYAPPRSSPVANTNYTGTATDYDSKGSRTSYYNSNNGTGSDADASNGFVVTHTPSSITVSTSPSAAPGVLVGPPRSFTSTSATPSFATPTSDPATNALTAAAVRATSAQASAQSPTTSAASVAYTTTPPAISSHVHTSGVPIVAGATVSPSPYTHAHSNPTHTGQSAPPVPPLPLAYAPSPLQFSSSQQQPPASSSSRTGTIGSPAPGPISISATVPPAGSKPYQQTHSGSASTGGYGGHVNPGPGSSLGGNSAMSTGIAQSSSPSHHPQLSHAQSPWSQHGQVQSDGRGQNAHLPPPYVFTPGYTPRQAPVGAGQDQPNTQQIAGPQIFAQPSPGTPSSYSGISGFGPGSAPTASLAQVSSYAAAPLSVTTTLGSTQPHLHAQDYTPPQSIAQVSHSTQLQTQNFRGPARYSANSEISSSNTPFTARGSSQSSQFESGQWMSPPSLPSSPGTILMPAQMEMHVMNAPMPPHLQQDVQNAMQSRQSPILTNTNARFVRNPNSGVASVIDISRGSTVPNLLDADDSESLVTTNARPRAVTTSTPPPLPPNPELLSLHTSILSALQSSFTTLQRTHAQTLARQRSQQEALLAGVPAIEDEMARLRAVKTVCESVSERLREVVEDGERRVETLRKMGDVSVDELVCASSIVHNQLINLVAEDNAIEDTLFHLHRSLNTGRIDLERFLRTTRVLAEEQFMKRALIDKIQKGVSMGSFAHPSSPLSTFTHSM